MSKMNLMLIIVKIIEKNNDEVGYKCENWPFTQIFQVYDLSNVT